MTLFQKIINREIPADIVYEDDLCLAFHDVNPQAPTHILVIPKEPITSMAELADSNKALMGHLLVVVAEIAKQQNLAESGYRVVINTNEDGGQTVFHLHIHLLGGRSLNWPPG